MIIHDKSIKEIFEHRKNELSENIDTYVLKLYPNIGTYTIFEFHYVHTDSISIYIYIYRERERERYRPLCYNKIKYAAKYDDLARFREAIRINIFSKSKTVLFENFKVKPTKTVENAKTEYFF